MVNDYCSEFHKRPAILKKTPQRLKSCAIPNASCAQCV